MVRRLNEGRREADIRVGDKESVKRRGRMVENRKKRTGRLGESYITTDSDLIRSVAEEVATAMQDMDWRDNLDSSYDTYDEAWDAYVDQIQAQLESDPQSVIDWLDDEEGSGVNDDLIRKVIRYFMKESKARRTSGRRIKESAGDSFVEFGTHELTQYLPKEIIDDLNTKVGMMYEIMNLVNDNDIVGEHDTKLYKLFNMDFDEIEYDVTDDTIRWFLENAWEELESYAKELGVEMDVRDGRNSPYITFNTSFLNALSRISGDHLPVTIDEVWDAVMESVLGGSYRASFTDDVILNQEIEQELDDDYDRMNDAEDAVEVAEDLLDDVLEVPVSALSEIIDELNACVKIINYIDDFKDNADDYFLAYLK